MQVLEHLDGAARGEAAGAMHDVGLERGADRRPPGRQRALEVRAHDAGEFGQARLGIVEQGACHRGNGLALEAPPDLGGDAVVRRGAHARQLVVEVGQRRRRWRRDEVRHVAGARSAGQQVEELVVGPAQALARRAHPRQVQGARGRVAQGVHAPDQVEERRDRKARADEVLVAEAVADHRRDCFALFG
jgi:hypothetical protein